MKFSMILFARGVEENSYIGKRVSGKEGETVRKEID
jgi:hypothetical protein